MADGEVKASTPGSTDKSTPQEETKDGGSFVKANAIKFRNKMKEQAICENMMEGVEGFKIVGNQKKMEIKNPNRTQDLFNALDVFEDNGEEFRKKINKLKKL